MQVLGRTEDLYNKGIRILQFLIGENGWEIDDFQTSLSRSLSEDKSELSVPATDPLSDAGIRDTFTVCIRDTLADSVSESPRKFEEPRDRNADRGPHGW